MEEPLVFLIDLDGTIQGDVTPQLNEYNLITYINTLILHGKKIKYNMAYLYKDMDFGLVRPGFGEALINMKAKHKNIEFFVYTASEHSWAYWIIDKICKHCFKNEKVINKPYFTRNHCLFNGKKMIEGIVKHTVIQTLKSKYPKAKFDNIFLVDNNIVLEPNELDRLILCPTYNHVNVNAIAFRNLTEEYVDAYHNRISKFLLGKNTKHKVDLFKKYYDKSYVEYKTKYDENINFLKDRYWTMFAEVITSKSKLNKPAEIISALKHLSKKY